MSHDGTVGASAEMRSAHVDALVVGVLELPDPLLVVRDHPILEGAVLHTPEDKL